MKLTNGMSSTDVCRIIEVAGKAGVTSLEIEGFCIKFNQSTTWEPVMSTNVAYPLAEQEDLMHNEDNDNDIDDHVEIDMDELMLTDSVAYERLQTGGELDA